MKHHHCDRDGWVIIHDDSYESHQEHHDRLGIPLDPCTVPDCPGIRWEHRPVRAQLRLPTEVGA